MGFLVDLGRSQNLITVDDRGVVAIVIGATDERKCSPTIGSVLFLPFFCARNFVSAISATDGARLDGNL